MNSLIQFKTTVVSLVITVLLSCFGLLSRAQAVSPPPDGDYRGGNTAEGFNALFNLSPQDGAFNTAIGFYALFANMTGSFNTAVGAGALDLNTSHNNTAVGAAALLLNTTGDGNTATGAAALLQNTTGRGNTATGGAALFSNTNGAGNTAVGALALFSNVGGPMEGDGSLNTAIGVEALTENTTGFSNTAVGGGSAGNGVFAALGSNTTGNGNTAVGKGALGANAIGSRNTAIGSGALGNLAPPVASPSPSATPTPSQQGNGNVAVGAAAGSGVTVANNVICIGEFVRGADVSDTTYIGNINTTAQPIVMGVDGVTVDLTTGKLGHGVSSRRFKEQIKPMDEASTALYALKPVTFHYKKAIDPTQTLDFGLIAEEVAAVNPELAVRDREGKISDYRHDAVNAMLLNEFLKAHRRMEEQEATIAKQQKQIDALTAGLEKVSAQLEVSKPATQMVENNR